MQPMIACSRHPVYLQPTVALLVKRATFGCRPRRRNRERVTNQPALEGVRAAGRELLHHDRERCPGHHRPRTPFPPVVPAHETGLLPLGPKPRFTQNPRTGESRPPLTASHRQPAACATTRTTLPSHAPASAARRLTTAALATTAKRPHIRTLADHLSRSPEPTGEHDGLTQANAVPARKAVCAWSAGTAFGRSAPATGYLCHAGGSPVASQNTKRKPTPAQLPPPPACFRTCLSAYFRHFAFR